MKPLYWRCRDGAVARVQDGVGRIWRGSRWQPLTSLDMSGWVMSPEEIYLHLLAVRDAGGAEDVEVQP